MAVYPKTWRECRRLKRGFAVITGAMASVRETGVSGTAVVAAHIRAVALASFRLLTSVPSCSRRASVGTPV